MSVKTWAKGKPESVMRTPIFEDWQQNQFKQLGQMGMEGLKNPTAGFEPMQQETMRQFSDYMPTLMNQIGSMGGMGGSSGHSSAYGQAGTQATQDLMTRLNAQKAQWGQGNIQNYMSMVNKGLTPQSELMFRERQPGAGELLGKHFMSNLLGPMGSGQGLNPSQGGQDEQGGQGGQGGQMAALLKILSMFA